MGKSHEAAEPQFAALPMRGNGPYLEVMLVTSRDTRRWVLPKGWADDHLTASKLAAREAFEEAGLLGRVGDVPIGSFEYEKRLRTGECTTCTVAVFPMQVDVELDDWPERKQRRRQWFGVRVAAQLVHDPELADLLSWMAEQAR